MNIFTEKKLQEVLEQHLTSDFFLNCIASTDDFQWFFFYLIDDNNDTLFSNDLQKAATIFRDFFASLSTNYMVCTKIPYNEMDEFSFFDYEEHCNEVFETFSSFMKNMAEAVIYTYFDIDNELMFFNLNEAFIKKISLIEENFQLVYETINRHEHFTATPVDFNSVFSIHLLNLEYYFQAKNPHLPITGQFVLRSIKKGESTYEVSLLQEASALIQELTSILEKEKQENELKLAFANESNKLKRLMTYLRNLNYEEGQFDTVNYVSNDTLMEGIYTNPIMLDYFRHNYELINQMAHERIVALFEENGNLKVRLNHPSVRIEQDKTPRFYYIEGYTLPLTVFNAKIQIDFSLPSKDKKLVLVINIQEDSSTQQERTFTFELM